MAFTAEALAGHPGFTGVLAHLARSLRTVHDETPRLARALTSHQRWLLSQAAFALYLERDPADPESGLTTVRLKELITGIGGASRNTVLNYLDEMVTYRFARYLDVPGRRYRRLEITEIAHAAMARWFVANLMALDALDGGERAAIMMREPQLLRTAQPLAARACLSDTAWREPTRRIAVFLWTESGGLVLDELVARLDPTAEREGRIDIGRIDIRRMAETFMLSRTHLQRVLKKAAQMGCIGWSDPSRAASTWVSTDFLREYAAWQAIKFAAIDQAFETVLRAVPKGATHEEETVSYRVRGSPKTDAGRGTVRYPAAVSCSLATDPKR